LLQLLRRCPNVISAIVATVPVEVENQEETYVIPIKLPDYAVYSFNPPENAIRGIGAALLSMLQAHLRSEDTGISPDNNRDRKSVV
jgi:hypothetical protein